MNPQRHEGPLPLKKVYKEDSNLMPREGEKKLDEIISALDFNLIKSIYKRELERHGVGDQVKQLIPVERIVRLHRLYPSYGTFAPELQVIGIGSERIGKTLEKKLLNPNIFKLFVLHNFFHEETHAVSGYQPEHANEQGRVVGYHRNEFGRTRFSDKSFFLALNEVVTDRLAREFEQEYIRATNFDNAENVRKWDEIFEESYKKNPDMQVLNAVISRIADTVGIPNEDVWKGFVGGMLRSEKLDEQEFQELIEEVTYPGFVREWGQIVDAHSALQVLDKLEGRPPRTRPGFREKLLIILGVN